VLIPAPVKTTISRLALIFAANSSSSIMSPTYRIAEMAKQLVGSVSPHALIRQFEPQ
jgi:hypothetical protein